MNKDQILSFQTCTVTLEEWEEVKSKVYGMELWVLTTQFSKPNKFVNVLSNAVVFGGELRYTTKLIMSNKSIYERTGRVI